MHPLVRIIDKKERFLIGLMSGTSADGIDAAVIRLVQVAEEWGDFSVLAFETIPYPEGLREELMRISAPDGGHVDAICRMNFVLGDLFAQAASQIAQKAALELNTIDLIGSHGQTIHHLPDPVSAFGTRIGATFQIGDPSVIAQKTGVVTVGDFRPADIARGGQGAPLVPYVDYLLFRSPSVSRGLLNIGGIANLTVLPAGLVADQIVAFDTGPGNMVIDAVAQTFIGQPYDEGGKHGRQGTICEPIVRQLLTHPYFGVAPPKSTGRELFGPTYTEQLMGEGRKRGLSVDDLMATATELTAQSVASGYRTFVAPGTVLDELIVSGGGARNPYLLERLAVALHPVRIVTSDERGLAADAKEAVAFAILANQTIMAQPGNMPGATGADRFVTLGKICLP